jgi:hypothetical protein
LATDINDRLGLVYQEAVRGIAHQERVVESLNTRAGNLIFAATFVSSLLGGRAIADGLSLWDWIATLLLLAIGAIVAFILWPYSSYTFRFDPEDLLRQYIDGDPDTTMAAMHRTLALRIKNDMGANWRTIQRIRVALQWALMLLVLEVFAWLLSIARLGMGT